MNLLFKLHQSGVLTFHDIQRTHDAFNTIFKFQEFCLFEQIEQKEIHVGLVICHLQRYFSLVSL